MNVHQQPFDTVQMNQEQASQDVSNRVIWVWIDDCTQSFDEALRGGLEKLK